MHCVARAPCTLPNLFWKAVFQGYLMTPRRSLELMEITIRVKTCQDTSLE
ncbi:hypothetical protein AURDEDRAFT_177795 [Auricularia subglabra TFB-10046 SS5]|uniref:Uncharacterized protein n=1 Tax=Auricularia subglabra (strain TFB-10046 / SS5) TaxID=717982 RepID=J0WLD2_AURST|nr:hypothetical protein AURDEDRAFT_177795 [Auricularia subglabra TFB-10046 SS5]